MKITPAKEKKVSEGNSGSNRNDSSNDSSNSSNSRNKIMRITLAKEKVSGGGASV